MDKIVNTQKNTVPYKLKKDADNQNYIVVEQEWSELKRLYMNAISNEVTEWPTQWKGQELLEKYVKHCFDLKKTDRNYGANPAEVMNWLRNGFYAKETFSHEALRIDTTEKQRFAWVEDEGELDVQRLFMGDDNPYLGMVKRKSKPGIRMEIQYAWNWNVRPEPIAQYGEWCAGLIAALETSGFDLEIFLDMTGQDVWEGSRGVILKNYVNVKRFGERSDFTEWSALFSPGGFRQLGFVAIPMACDKIGTICKDGLGHAIGNDGWGVQYDTEKSILRITCNQHSSGEQFPEKELTMAAIDTGLI